MTSSHSHLLNLLPPEDQTRIGRQRLARFFTYTNAGIAILLLTGNALLLPTYFFLFFQNQGAQELLAAQQQTINTEQAHNIETRIQQINAALNQLQTYNAITQEDSLTTLITHIIAEAPLGITLASLSFDKETNRVTIRGNAVTRNDLLQFISAIRAQPAFYDVQSPVENILREKNILFTLSLTVRNEKNI